MTEQMLLVLQEVLNIHKVLIARFGGIQGLRVKDLLQSVIERPFSGFSNTQFYPSAEEKASAILENIVNNLSFLDGNQRTGYVLIR